MYGGGRGLLANGAGIADNPATRSWAAKQAAFGARKGDGEQAGSKPACGPGAQPATTQRRMTGYIIRRLIAVPFMMLGISLILFLLLYIRPGSAAFAAVASIGDADPGSFERFEERFGLNRPWYEQYGDWLLGAFRGDLGETLTPPHDGVTGQILERLPNTIEVGLLTIFIAAVFGISVGVLSAVKRNSLLDYSLRTITIAGISIPNFWIAVLFVTLPAIWWEWTPFAFRWVSFTENPFDNLAIVIWPAVTLALASAAGTARLVRTSMLEVLYSDYVRTARAKGLRERGVILGHVFRNSLIPVITLIGLQTGAVLGGVVIAELIFGIPGLGRLTLDAVLAQDYPLVLGSIMMFSLVFILVTLIVDVLYSVVDPRIRY